MRNKKVVLIGIIVFGLVFIAMAIGSILGKSVTEKQVVDSEGNIITGSNAEYAIARKEIDKQVDAEYEAYIEQAIAERDKQMLEEEDTDEEDSIPVEDFSNCFSYSYNESLEYWASWESSNVESVYCYSDDYIPDMITGLLSGYIKECPMITVPLQDRYSDGFVPKSNSISIDSLDTASKTAEVSITFEDGSSKSYTVSYSLDESDLVDDFIVEEVAVND